MTKIPIMDEFVRSVQSFGDTIMGDEAAARRRWENYHNDSLLGNAVMAGGSFIAAVFGRNDNTDKYIKQASGNLQKFGAAAISSVSHAVGIAAQAATFGVPNPVSGALNGFASGVNRIVDEDAKGGTNGISWDDLSKESVIGFAKGAASSGGMIPYAGTAVEKELRGEKVEFDHREEWSNCVINAALSAGTATTVKQTAAWTKAGKVGVKGAVAIGGTSGLALGSGAALLSQEVQSLALERRMRKDGYKYDRDEEGDDGREYVVYTKKGMPDISVPKPDKGNILSQGVMQGVTTVAALKKQLQQNESLPGNYDTRHAKKSEIPDDQLVNRNQRDEKQSPINVNVNYGEQIFNFSGSQEKAYTWVGAT